MMTEAEYQALKATMPWTHKIVGGGFGGQVYVLDKNGEEVPLFDLIKFTEFITAKITAPKAPQ